MGTNPSLAQQLQQQFTDNQTNIDRQAQAYQNQGLFGAARQNPVLSSLLLAGLGAMAGRKMAGRSGMMLGLLAPLALQNAMAQRDANIFAAKNAAFDRNLTNTKTMREMMQAPAGADLYNMLQPGLNATGLERPEDIQAGAEGLSSAQALRFGIKDSDNALGQWLNVGMEQAGGIPGQARMPLMDMIMKAQGQGQPTNQGQAGGMQSNPVQAMFDQDGTATLQGNMQADGFPGLPQFMTPEVANTILTQRANNARTGLSEASPISRAPYQNLQDKTMSDYTLGPRTQETLANTEESRARASLYNRTDPNLRGGGGDPVGQGLSHMNAIFQGLNNQEAAIKNRLVEMGFISQDTKTKGQLLQPVGPSRGYNLFGVGAGFGGPGSEPGDSPETVKEYNELVSRLNQIRAMKSSMMGQTSGTPGPLQSIFSGGQAGTTVDQEFDMFSQGRR